MKIEWLHDHDGWIIALIENGICTAVVRMGDGNLTL